jgi:predicted NBD/HSP70 family sugar kinase
MAQTIGISAAGKISIGLVEDNRIVSSVGYEDVSGEDIQNEVEILSVSMLNLPMEKLVETLAGMVKSLCVENNSNPAAVGMCFPGIIREGVIEESPNLKQAKGANLRKMLSGALESVGVASSVSVCNDADAVATGIAAKHGYLEKSLRVWTLGQGVGFGRYPHLPGPCEGGHTVVSMDPKEAYCGCGGKGHLEGIMGHRAMRMRFLDLEPEEVFARAREGDQRCADFELLWHRALAAASATGIHLEGPGKFFISGPNSRFVKVGMLNGFLHEMVTMSPLQGSVFEVIPASEELAIIGAAVNAGQ